MAARSQDDVIEEALQGFSQGFDTESELLFLDLLSKQLASDKEQPSQDGDVGTELEKHEVDVSVCDIKIVLSNPGRSDQERNFTKKADEKFRGASQKCVNEEKDCNEIDAECKGLSQIQLSSGGTSVCADSSELIDDSASLSMDGNGSISPELSQGNHTQSSDIEKASQVPKNLSLLLQNVDLNYVCADFGLVDKFVWYVFTRRYGPADKESSGDNVPEVNFDSEVIATVNRRLDAVLKRLMDLPVTEQLMSAYSTVLQKASKMPTVRKKMSEHVMLWLGRHGASLDESTFKRVKTLVLTGLSDVWSVVRKICSTGVSRVFRDWSPGQQEDLFCSLLEICIDMEGSWQSKDGAALCVHSVIFHCFASSVQTKEGVSELPSYIVECVLTIVFSLISHPQLSIRETVTKIMTAYMVHVDSQDMLDLMHQTLTLLTPPAAEREASESFHCVEAYAAEGLLNICTSIFKVLPVRKAVHLWLIHCSAFLTYLSHNASSVRQTTSTLCVHVATHRESLAVLMKLVMYYLTQAWPVSLRSLAACYHFLPDVDHGTMTWEGMEGRMFVYELLCKHLIECHMASADSKPSSLSFQSVCSQDGGSETKESVEDVYRCVASHLAGQSLLSQLFLLDNTDCLADDAGIKILSESELQELQRWLLVHYPCLSHECGQCVSQHDDLTLPTCRQLLVTMLHHTAICLAHTRWELRRIAQQVLPCLCEVMCLYDAELIMSVWRYITVDASLLSFLGLYALHQSLALCAGVVATADLTDKESAISNPIYFGFVDGVRKHIGEYLPLVCCHLRRDAYDKMSVVAAETALLALNFFDLHKQIKDDLCSAIMVLWKNLFIFAHPKSAIATSLFLIPRHEFQSPYEGFLSCCLVRPESNVQCAKQVEKNLMTAIHKHLPHFLPQLSSSASAFCLPLLAHNIGLFIDDSEVCKSLINSFNTLCQCTKKSFAKMASDTTTGDSPGDQPLKCVYLTIKELTAIIALKSLDVALLQKLLGCYLIVCESLQPETHIPLLLQGVAVRLSEGGGFHIDTADGGELDMRLCWHRPELPPGFGQHNSTQDEDSFDRTSCTEENESDTSLNRSSSSLGLQLYSRTGRRRTLSTTNDVLEIREMAARLSSGDKGNDGEAEQEEEEEEDEESDWDSWSEDEPDQEQSTLRSHFEDFFRRLADFYGAEGSKVLQDEMVKLSKREQDLLQDLIMTA